jgi:hypothetical protein
MINVGATGVCVSTFHTIVEEGGETNIEDISVNVTYMLYEPSRSPERVYTVLDVRIPDVL